MLEETALADTLQMKGGNPVFPSQATRSLNNELKVVRFSKPY